MKTEIKEKWLSRLRSGEYSQTSGSLQRTEEERLFSFRGEDDVRHVGYCCLGVLCEIAREEGVVDVVDVYAGGRVVYGVKGSDKPLDSNASYLPEPVVQWAQLRTNNGHFIVDGKDKFLSHINDAGATFEEIADIIEENF